jgi:hypothetical protein
MPGQASRIPDVWARGETLISSRVRETGNGLAEGLSWRCPKGLIKQPDSETLPGLLAHFEPKIPRALDQEDTIE